MQLAIELPDDTAREVLRHDNVQEFIKRAIEKELSAENFNNKIEPPLFEQLRLNDEYADDELALLFERDKDTGRDVAL